MDDAQHLIPEVTEEDIDWVCRLMNLRDFDQARKEFLRARSSLDVSACPGSGKTTLIVAKLAIMARKWPHRTKGICVLSHTNVAREEIQRRLHGTIAGQQLLSYPHFIDTTHGFVNRFLALPWLNSNGYPSPTVDDDVTTAYRRNAIGERFHQILQGFLEKTNRGLNNLRIRDRELHFDFPAGSNTKTFEIAERAIKASSQAGYFCYDEMFVWARALLEDCPAVSIFLQCRFPLVIIDEMQDTSELQANILDSVFPLSGSNVVLQRVGDPNQAIFDAKQSEIVMSSAFPNPSTCSVIPSSFRFGPEIAALASPFAIDTEGLSGLQGLGPRVVGDAPKSCLNTLFIFQDSEASGVVEAYGKHVLSTFSDYALSLGKIAAVGGVHKDPDDVTLGHHHFPKSVPNYWSGYTAEVARSDPHPKTFIQYVRVAKALVHSGRDLAPGVEKIASGLVRMARRAGGSDLLGRRAPKHRTLVETLATNPAAIAAYRRLLRTFLLDREVLTPVFWAERRADILLVVAGLSGSDISDSANSFLNWDEHSPSLTVTQSYTGPNVYKVDDDTGRSVDIHLGSIHSVKGQTHLATLLLSTYWHDHSAKKMLPWLLGKKRNLDGAGSRDRYRLLQTYVAMTRPSHLLCLAIPTSVLGGDAVRSDNLSTLQSRGWAVANVIDGAPHWIT